MYVHLWTTGSSHVPQILGAQVFFVHLTHRVSRNPIDEAEGSRRLVRRHVLPRPRPELRFAHRGEGGTSLATAVCTIFYYTFPQNHHGGAHLSVRKGRLRRPFTWAQARLRHPSHAPVHTVASFSKRRSLVIDPEFDIISVVSRTELAARGSSVPCECGTAGFRFCAALRLRGCGIGPLNCAIG